MISMLVAHYEIQLAPGSLVPPGEIDVTAGITLMYVQYGPFTCLG